MKIIAHLFFAPGADVQAFLAIRAEEAAMVWRLYKEGKIRDAALRTDLKGAVLTFEAASEDEVRTLLAEFPAVEAGLFAYDLLAVGPFLSWETLFTKGIMSEDLGAVVQPFYAAFASGDVASLDTCFAPDWRDNTLPPGRAPGLEGIKQAIGFLRTILPDLTARQEDVRVAGDVVTVRTTFRGTNTGGWPGVGPTGAPVSFIAFDMHRIAGERIVESWHLEDNLALMKQLGVIPPLG